MRPRALIRILTTAMASAPVLVRGALPATQQMSELSVALVDGAPQNNSSDDASTRQGDHPAGNDVPQPGRNHPGRAAFQPPSAEDLKDAMLFMSSNSPRQYAALNKLPDNQRKTNLKNLATRMYLQVMRDEPELRDAAIKRIKLEDEVFGLASELRDPPAGKQPDQTKSELKEKLKSLVAAGITERELRLKNLEDTVKRAHDKLDKDKVSQDVLVDKRYNDIVNSNNKGLVPSFGGAGVDGERGNTPRNRGQRPTDGTPPGQ